MAAPGPITETSLVTSVTPVARNAPVAPVADAQVARAPAVPAAAGKPEPAPREDAQALAAKIAERLNQYLKDSGRDVEYRVDAAAGTTVLTVRRSDTGEIVRQFPSDEALAWLRRLNERSGTFLDALA